MPDRIGDRPGGDLPTVIIRGGTVIDQHGTRRADVLVTQGLVAAVDDEIAGPTGAVVLDATGCVVAPGLVDLHTHLREPGREESETIETGTRAASLGGYTAVVAMPNTEPALDSAEAVRNVLELAATAMAEVAVAGAITVGRAGERLAPMAELADLGVRLFTDDGAGVQSAGVMRRALEYATGIGVTLAQHCEDGSLAANGAMHEGEWSSRLGIPGMAAVAEEAMVARDIALVRACGARIHFLHLSTAISVDMVRRAKAEGLAVTAEAAPHHFSLTDGCASGYDPVFKVNPPLRPQSDVDAVKAGLADGTIDAIATDHAPHPPELKDLPFDQAPPGMLGLQTAASLAIGELGLPMAQLLALMSWQPASDRPARPVERRRPGRPDRAGGGRQPLRHRSGGHLDRGRRRPGQPEPQLALRRAQAHRPGAAHRVPGRTGGRRRRGPAMTGRSGAPHRTEAALVLADGAVFEGEAIGARPERGVATGEAVFNTVLSGYQEVITDPSYAGQVIAFTYPHIGNYGVNPTDDEAARPHCRGVIVRDLCDRPSSWRSTETLEAYLTRRSVPGITGVDTRRLTRHLRDEGAMPCAFGTAGLHELQAAAGSRPFHRRGRPGVDGDDERGLHERFRALPGGGLRLRHQRGHAAPAGRDGHRHRGAGLHTCRTGAGLRTRRDLPVQRTR